MFDDEFINTDSRVVHIGADHHYMFYSEEDNPRAGIFFIHKDKDGQWCSFPMDIGTENFPNPSTWQASFNDQDKLTIEPSIVCTICGDHGFIVDDEWQAHITQQRKNILEIALGYQPASGRDWLEEFKHIETHHVKDTELATSIHSVGIYNDIILDDDDKKVVDGHKRIYAVIVQMLDFGKDAPIRFNENNQPEQGPDT